MVESKLYLTWFIWVLNLHHGFEYFYITWLLLKANKDNAKENEPEETRQNNLSSPDSNFNAEQSRPFTLQFEEKKTPDFMKSNMMFFRYCVLLTKLVK